MEQDTVTQKGRLAEDLAYQDSILQGVSRTFALTIPQLPESLRTLVGNAYLLCRIADTIEDATTLDVEQKKHFSEMFAAVVEGRHSCEAFAGALSSCLDTGASDAEKDLIRNAPRVLRITQQFSEADRGTLARCVRIMAEGMETFQEGRFAHGLRDQAHLDAYCYHVAGVVGEMLTELFCTHSEVVAGRKNALSRLAVSFGEGLQTTNILKDIWDDKRRDVCWLPQSVFDRYGFDLKDLSTDRHGTAFQRGLGDLIAMSRGHLKNALKYVLLVPASERGIRTFCLLAIGMAVLTLRNINRRRDFTSASEVKISRRSVYATVFATKVIGRSNTLLRLAFALLAAGLPRTLRA
jgi:farnesyl-diphosphate farnesyltransferase